MCLPYMSALYVCLIACLLLARACVKPPPVKPTVHTVSEPLQGPLQGPCKALARPLQGPCKAPARRCDRTAEATVCARVQRNCLVNIMRACIGLAPDNNMLLEHKLSVE